MEIRRYAEHESKEIANLFHGAVHQVASDYYSKAECEAWAPTPPDYLLWQKRLQQKQPLVAVIDRQIAGFIELDADGHIDCAYTHKDFQRKGVASALYLALELEARQRGIKRLYVEASYLARAFFAKHGFDVVRENQVVRKNETLVNFTMEKWLD